VGAAIEGVAAHEEGRLAADAQCHEHFSIQGAMAHGVVAVVGQIDRVIGPHGHAVGSGVNAFAPGAEEVPLPVEDNHRVFAPVEHVNVVF